MKDLIIVGAGGFGRELAQIIEDINQAEKTWNVLGYIDDNPDALEGYPTDYRIIGTITEWEPSPAESFVCAIADPDTKEKVTNLLKSKGAVFASIVHPKATIGKFNRIGEGFIAYPNAVVTSNVTIGDFVVLLSSGIGHDSIIGDYTTICAFSDITGGCHIGSHVWMGTHSTVIPGRTIGNHVYVGAGSVVMTDFPDHVKVLGNPARKINF